VKTLGILLLISLSFTSLVRATTCEEAAATLNRQLQPKVDAPELATALHSLNASSNRHLPDKFITKNKARATGWKPGRDLWSVAGLAGKSIGGDRFGNREKRLPDGGRKWREADLDYKGGHRGAKRLLFSNDGLRLVTVDHYRSFVEVPACR
jgi:hypothetical protein